MINFTDEDDEIDCLVLLRPDRMERIHIYRRPDGTFGRRNYVWIADEQYPGWTLGGDWGHWYDSMATAFKEAFSDYPWAREYLGIIQ